MLADLFFYSVFLGLIGLLPLTEKYKKTSSFLFVMALTFLTIILFIGYRDQNIDTFSFFWMRTQKYRIEININSALKNYIMLFPVFVMSLLMAFQKIFTEKEQEGDNFYALVSFNLANMIVLISSQNLVQLLTCIYVADIISQAMIKNFRVSKKYIFYSLFADLGLFMIFAIIQGKLKSFNLEGFVAYKKIGRHKDFVAISAMLFIFVKMGLFMFQAALLDLKNIKTYKLVSIVSFIGVLSVFFVLIKIYPLLQISDYSQALMVYAVVSSAIWGLVCGVIMAGTNRQIVYFNMLLYAFVIYAFINKGAFDEESALYLLLGYFTSWTLAISGKYIKIILRSVIFIAWTVIFYFYQSSNLPTDILRAVILLSIVLIGNIRWFYKFESLQKADIFSRIYDILLIKPVMILGRGLWLLVDFTIMEKHVVGKVEAAGNISSGYIEKIKNCRFSMKLLWLIYLFFLFMISFYFGGVRI